MNLRSFPDCVIIAGSLKEFGDRYREMGIDLYRGSGSGFRDKSIFGKPFCSRECLIDSVMYVRLGLGSSFGFNVQISDDEIQTAVRNQLSNAGDGRSPSQIRPVAGRPVAIMEGSPSVVRPVDLHAVIKKNLTSVLEDSDASEFTLKMDNDNMVPNRSTKFVYGTLLEVLCSKVDGMDLAGEIAQNTTTKWELDCIQCMITLQGLKTQGHVFYCGMHVGVHALPGSDGQCGPTNGPHCAACTKRQNAIDDRQVLNIKILAAGNAYTTVQVLSTKMGSHMAYER